MTDEATENQDAARRDGSRLSEGLGPLLKPHTYIWPEQDGRHEVCYSPSGPGQHYPVWTEAQVREMLAAQRERMADGLPARTVQRIKDLCAALDLDYVAFAWKVQREAARRA